MNFRAAGLCALLSLLCWFLLFHHLDRRDLWNSHEGRAAQDGQTLLDHGMSGLPALYDGQVELQKPPLYYWCVAAIGYLQGGKVNALCVRLPSALAAWGCVLALFVWCWRRQRPAVGLLAAAMLATAMHFTWSARIGRIDMPLTLCITLALLLLDPDEKLVQFDAPNRQGMKTQFGRLLAAYLLLALAVLLKGPVGLVLPLAVLGTWLLVNSWIIRGTPSNRMLFATSLRVLGLWWGIPLVLAIVLPCFCWLNWTTGGEFLRVFFWYHNVERGFGSETLPDHPWWLYIVRLPLDLLPWGLLLPLAIWHGLRRRMWQDDPVFRFGAVWFVAMTLVLSCARFKRADYMLPAYPGLFLCLGCVAEHILEHVSFRRSLRLGMGLALFAYVLGWVWYIDVRLPAGEEEREYRTFAKEVRSHAPAPRTVWFFRTESHTLAFHLGRPVQTFVRWEDLERLAAEAEPNYVVMPAKVAQQWPTNLRDGALEEIGSTDRDGVRHEKPLVLLRTRPPDLR
jgi:4-amino-4-deoxy-L-arabinose transferase-like glycosyltransferase